MNDHESLQERPPPAEVTEGASNDQVEAAPQEAAPQETKTFTDSDAAPVAGPEPGWPSKQTASERAYDTSSLSDDEIEKLLGNVKNEQQLTDLMKAYPADQKRIFESAKTSFSIQAAQNAMVASQSDATQESLTQKHGLRPRKYEGALTGENLASLVVRQVMPEVAEFLNERLKERGYKISVSVAELTTNMFAEGGIVAVLKNRAHDLDGFVDIGIDTFMDRYNSLRPWLHPCLAIDRLHKHQTTNEKKETVNSINELSWQQAAYASGAMWVQMKARLAVDLRKQGKNIDDLSDAEQMYWTTVYFNAGEGTAAPQLAKHGVAGANRRWTKEDNYQRHHRDPHYNAKQRTASYEYTRDVATPGGNFKPVAPDQIPKARAEVDARLAELDNETKFIDGQIASYQQIVDEDEAALRANPNDKEAQVMLKQTRESIVALKQRKERLKRVHQEEVVILERIRRNQLGDDTRSAQGAPSSEAPLEQPTHE